MASYEDERMALLRRMELLMTSSLSDGKVKLRMRDNDEQSSDDSDSETTSPPVPKISILTPSASTPADTNIAPPKLEKLDPSLVGMSVGYKNLYSGKEDKRGRFQWQNTIPEDLGKPAEDAETQKWALIARYVKAYNDPQKVLTLHSIVVQSPILRQVLEGILKNYPGVTVGLKRLEFSGKFEPLIHHFADLKKVIDELKSDGEAELDSEATTQPESSAVIPTDDQQASADTAAPASPSEDDETNPSDVRQGEESATASQSSTSTNHDALKLEHTQLLYDLLNTEFQSVIESSQDMMAKSVMTYEYLWTLFQPGHMIFSRIDGQDRVLKLQSTKYGVDRDENPCFWLTLSYVDYDGTKFGYSKTNVSIATYAGTKNITSLSAFPLEYHTQKAEIRQRLIERGTRMENFAGTHYRSYDGVGWKYGNYGEKEKYTVKGRVIIDAVGWNRYNPNFAIFLTSFNIDGGSKIVRFIPVPTIPGDFPDPDDEDGDDGDIGDSGGMPFDGHFADEEEQPKQAPLTTEQKLICTSLLRGYALKEKMWLNLFVNSVHDITFNTRAFETLVLPAKQKELVLGFTATQQAYRNAYDDVIEGKGRGIIILLCGPPGVGKTLTAESVAEEMKVPLFVMSAGDLGMDSRTIEARLLAILSMVSRWNAILLLDEADIFLEARSLHEIERNKLVSIFLRLVEYNEGIMFLTTNRVETFDPAFQSRIHISLNYPELAIESRTTVWQNFLAQHNATQAASRERPPKNPTSAIKTDRTPTNDAGVTDAETEAEVLRKKHEGATQPHSITPREIEQLSLMDMNGRQIKNVLKTAQLLASYKCESLRHSHVMTVLDVTQHLHNATREVERTRASIFS